MIYRTGSYIISMIMNFIKATKNEVLKMTDSDKIKLDSPYEKERKELMQEWMKKHAKEGRQRFICDGIADSAVFGHSYPRICFLLKECYFEGTHTCEDCQTLVEKYMRKNVVSKEVAKNKVKNDKGHSFWLDKLNVLCNDTATGMQYYDLAAHLGKGVPWYMWVRITEWMVQMEEAFGWRIAATDDNKDQKGKDIKIKRLAVVNIKKSDGTNNSADGTWEGFAKSDKDLLIRELELIKPQIIICGGTYAVAEKSGLLGNKKEAIRGGNFIRSVNGFTAAYDDKQDYLVFDTVHPTYPACSYDAYRKQINALAAKMKKTPPFDAALDSLM